MRKSPFFIAWMLVKERRLRTVSAFRRQDR